MVKGRIHSINGRKLNALDYDSVSTRRLLRRELNLSYGKEIPKHNKIVVGRELNSNKSEVSVEKGIAESFGIRVNDKLGFEIAGEIVHAKVTSIRSLKWESMEVNFFMFLSNVALKDKPQSLITSFYLKPVNSLGEELSNRNKEQIIQGNFKTELLQKFSNLTVVDVEIIINQVRKLISQSIFAVEFLFIFCLLSGSLVLWAYGGKSFSSNQRGSC